MWFRTCRSASVTGVFFYADVLSSLNRQCHIFIDIGPIASSPKASWNFWMVPTCELCSFWQKLIQYGSIFSLWKWRTDKLLSRSLCKAVPENQRVKIHHMRFWRCPRLVHNKRSRYSGLLHHAFVQEEKSDTFWTARWRRVFVSDSRFILLGNGVFRKNC